MMKTAFLVVAVLGALGSVNAAPERYTYRIRIPSEQTRVTVQEQQNGGLSSISYLLNFLQNSNKDMIDITSIPGGEQDGRIQLKSLPGNSRGVINISSLVNNDNKVSVNRLINLIQQILRNQQGGGQQQQQQNDQQNQKDESSANTLQIILNKIPSDQTYISISSIPNVKNGKIQLDNGEIDISGLINNGRVNATALRQKVQGYAAQKCQDGLINNVKNSAQSGLNKATDTAGNVVSGVGGKNLGGNAANAVNSVVNGSGMIIMDASCRVGNAVNDVKNALKSGDLIGGAKNVLNEGVGAVGDAVNDKLGEVKGIGKAADNFLKGLGGDSNGGGSGGGSSGGGSGGGSSGGLFGGGGIFG